MDMIRRIAEYDPQRYEAILRMPFKDVVPFIEQHIERINELKKRKK